MKKLMILVAVAFLNSQCHAQLSKGRMMLGCAFNYNQASNSSHDTTLNGTTPISKNYNVQEQHSKSLNVNLNIGYFISNHIVIGLTGAYQYGYTSSNYTSLEPSNTYNTYYDNSNQSSYLFSAGAYSRYYQMIGDSRFAFFCQLSAAYLGGHSSGSSSDSYNNIASPVITSKTNVIGFNAALSPGFTYFINNRFALETLLGSISYTAQKNKNFQNANESGKTTSNSLRTNFSLNSVYFGLSYYFGG